MVIKIFTTGGTIDKVYFDAERSFEVGKPLIGAILREASVQAAYEVETLLRKDSQDLTDADRRLILDRVSSDASTRVLITHGTDTMVDTALCLRSIAGKTIVLVGSLSPALFKDSDAAFNIGFAMSAVQLLPPGVYITMHGRVLDPTRVRKNRERNVFEAIEGP